VYAGNFYSHNYQHIFVMSEHKCNVSNKYHSISVGCTFESLYFVVWQRNIPYSNKSYCSKQVWCGKYI